MSGNSSPTDGHLAMDDRAWLLPPSSSSFTPPTLGTSAQKDARCGREVYGASASASAAAAAADGDGDAAVGTELRAKPSSIEVGPESSSSNMAGEKGGSSLDVYTITADDSLPSHMRSLLPGHDKHVHDLLTLERTRQRLRYVIVGLTLMLALTVVVAVGLVLSLKVTPTSLTEFMVTTNGGGGRFHASPVAAPTDAQDSGVQTEVQISKLDGVGSEDNDGHHHHRDRARYRPYGPKERRAPCLTECWSYAAFRFRSTCDDGFCRCHGDNYDPDTCLPKYHNCNIHKEFPGQSSAKLFGRNQTSYVCHVPQSRDSDAAGGGIHVISIFGNYKAETTKVIVRQKPPSSSSSSSSSPSSSSSSSSLPLLTSPSSSSSWSSSSSPSTPSGRTLVLVNYHYVEWTVRLPEGSDISSVIIVSMKRGNQADRIHFLGSNKDPDVQVTHRLSLTGYGEDKNGGHTPRLLRFVEDQIGPVTSFVGASHADEILLDLNKDSTIGKYDV